MSREIDAAVAECIFGWANVAPDCYVHDGKDWCGTDPSGTGGYYGTGRKIVPHYSTDIARAWEVVERLHPLRYKIEVYETDPEKQFGAGYMVTIWRGQTIMAHAHAETVCLAICLAALGTRPAGGGDPKGGS